MTTSLATIAPLLAPLAAAAEAKPADVVQCAPNQQWCVAALTKKRQRHLDVFRFNTVGPYRLCVTPPGRAERCKNFKLVRNASGAGASSVAVARHFPYDRRGKYRARWIIGGKQLGRTLTFVK